MTQIEEMITYINDVRHRLGWDLIDTNESMMGYLEDEIKELRIEIDQNHPQGIEDELMDVLFVCLSLIHDNHIELHSALKRKLEAVVQKYEAR